jgi:hypothetical protein
LGLLYEEQRSERRVRRRAGRLESGSGFIAGIQGLWMLTLRCNMAFAGERKSSLRLLVEWFSAGNERHTVIEGARRCFADPSPKMARPLGDLMQARCPAQAAATTPYDKRRAHPDRLAATR